MTPEEWRAQNEMNVAEARAERVQLVATILGTAGSIIGTAVDPKNAATYQAAGAAVSNIGTAVARTQVATAARRAGATVNTPQTQPSIDSPGDREGPPQAPSFLTSLTGGGSMAMGVAVLAVIAIVTKLLRIW